MIPEKFLQALSAGPPVFVPQAERRPLVFFNTPWKKRDDGWSIAARAYARAMSLGGVDVRLCSVGGSVEDPEEDVLSEVSDLVEQPATWDVQVVSTVVSGAGQMQRISRKNLGTEPQGFHCVFERQYLEPALVDLLNAFDSVWAQCSANRDVLKRCGVRRVSLIYHPYFDDDPHLQIPAPLEARRWLWCGRFEPRKAPDNIIRGFLRAFKPGEATLTMKLSPYSHLAYYPGPEEVLLQELCEREVMKNGWTPLHALRNIRVIRGSLSREEMVALHASHDVYVSASRGEGLDLPAFAAKLSGRKLVTTDSGGPRDFLNDGDLLVQSTGTIPADPSYPWGAGATYADYDLDALVAAMQQARSSRPVGSRVPEIFRAEHVGKRFRKWIGELTGR